MVSCDVVAILDALRDGVRERSKRLDLIGCHRREHLQEPRPHALHHGLHLDLDGAALSVEAIRQLTGFRGVLLLRGLTQATLTDEEIDAFLAALTEILRQLSTG